MESFSGITGSAGMNENLSFVLCSHFNQHGIPRLERKIVSSIHDKYNIHYLLLMEEILHQLVGSLS